MCEGWVVGVCEREGLVSTVVIELFLEKRLTLSYIFTSGL